MAINAATLNIGIGVTGDAAAVEKVSKLARSAERVQEKTAKATRSMAAFGLAAARAGELGGSSLAGLLSVGSDIAFGFGATGAIVGAIGVSIIAIKNLFDTTAEKGKELVQQMKKQFADLSRIALAQELTNAETRLAELKSKNVEYDAKTGLAKRSRDAGEIAALEKKISLLRQEIALRDRESRLHPGQAYAEEIGALNALKAANALTAADRQRAIRLDQSLAEQLKQTNLTLGARSELESQRHALAEILKVDSKSVIDGYTKEADHLATLFKLDAIHGEDIQRLDTLERALAAALEKTNLKLADRVALEQALAKVRATRAEAFGHENGPEVLPVDLGPAEKAPKVPVQVVPQFTVDNAGILLLQDQIKEILEAEFNSKQLAVNLEFAEFGGNVVEGLAGAFGEAAGHGFENAGGIVLAALGGIFKKMGSALIAYGAAMKALLPHLLNPFTSGPAAIAAGALLVALGTALSGLATGTGGGGSGGGFSSNVGEVTQAAQVTNITVGASGTQRTAAELTPMQPQVFNVFGPGDPMAQRAVIEAYDLGKRRGL